MDKIAVIRLRGSVSAPRSARDTLKILGLKSVNSLVIIEKNERNLGMIKKIEDYVAWGEAPVDVANRKKLHPPKGGLKSAKLFYPKGDLGYRGDKISDLIKRMSE